MNNTIYNCGLTHDDLEKINNAGFTVKFEVEQDNQHRIYVTPSVVIIQHVCDFPVEVEIPLKFFVKLFDLMRKEGVNQ